MAWVTPKTWSTDMADADLLNEQLRDNLNALKDPPSAVYTFNRATDFTLATINTWLAIDSSLLALTITTTGGDVVVHFHGSAEHSGPNYINFNIYMDGVAIAGDNGVVRARPSGAGANGTVNVSFTYLITDVSPGAHLFEIWWFTPAATATLLAGAGSATGRDVHGQFWVRELT